jgi:hypothetical protein
MDINKENAICKEPMRATLRMPQRRSYAVLPDTDPVLKLKRVSALNKPKIVKDSEVFDFSNGNKKPTTKKEKKLNKDKRFNPRKGKDKKEPIMRNRY